MSKLAFSMMPDYIKLKDGTEVTLVMELPARKMALVRDEDGQEEFISIDMIEEEA